MSRLSLFGLELSPVGDREIVLSDLRHALDDQTRAWLVTFVNPHSWFIKRKIRDYAEDLQGFDWVLPDGIGVVKALRWAEDTDSVRLSFDGTSLYHPVFGLLDKRNAAVYVVGGVPGVAVSAGVRMKQDYSGIHIAGVRDGFGDWDETLDDIIASKADFVLCGMGAPRQEHFLLALQARGFKGTAFTCGGFLDQLAETTQYYPSWINRFELRWVYRLYKEPRRLGRRYLVEYFPFVRAIMMAIARIQLAKALPSTSMRQRAEAKSSSL